MTTATLPPKEQLLQAALMHVPFDGWSQTTFDAAIDDSGIERAVADSVCPRGAVDLAIAYHQQGDAQMLRRMKETDLDAMK